MSPGAAAWARACLALDLIGANPGALRGLTVRARSGPVRDTFLAALARRMPQPVRRIHPATPRDALLGGLDVTGTLKHGRAVETVGLLHQPGTLVLSMAERCPPDLAAILASALDSFPDLVLIVLDEGADRDEGAPAVLTDRLAFHVFLDDIGRLDATPPPRRQFFAEKLPPPRLRSRRKPSDNVVQLTSLATRLGIDNLRIPFLAVRTAETLSRSEKPALDEDILRQAAELVLAPRAKQLPEDDDPDTDPPDQNPPQPPPETTPQNLPDTLLIEAVRAALPDNVLDSLQSSDRSRSTGSGAGQRRKGNRRGRPLPSRHGRLDGAARLDLVATLRSAAPWQTIRKRDHGPLRIFPSDIRLRRYEEQSDRLVIFAVDASGSAALARLGEAKGAVELLLARAYAARDHVALIAFRGTTAELLLPPTRSLVQTKRRLAALPGGGGTPLAAGLKTAADLATISRAKGLSPILAILTDGRANIALDGAANRTQAAEDSTQMALFIRRHDLPTVVLDLGTRPQPQLATLAATMGGQYLALPRADAVRMNQALSQVMDDGLGA